MDQKLLSVKISNRSQSSKCFTNNSIYLEGTTLMSSFDDKSLKKVTLKSIYTHECDTFNYG